MTHVSLYGLLIPVYGYSSERSHSPVLCCPRVTGGVRHDGNQALDSYPVSTGPPGSVDKIRLQRVVDVMQRFLKFPAFDISSMLLGSGQGRRATG